MKALLCQTWAKITAFILAGIFLAATVGFGCCTLYIFESNLFFQSEDAAVEHIETYISSRFLTTVYAALYYEDGKLQGMNSANTANNGQYFHYEITDLSTGELLFTNRQAESYAYRNKYTTVISISEWSTDEPSVESTHKYYVTIYSKDFPAGSRYEWIESLYMMVYHMRHAFFALTLCAFALFLLLLSFLLRAVGHRKGEDTVRSRYLDKIPMDLMTVLCGFGVVGACALIGNAFWSYIEGWNLDRYLILGICLIGLLAVVIYCLCMAWLLTLLLQIKQGVLIKKTFVWWLTHLLYRWFKKPISVLVLLLRNLPLIWKTAVITAGVSFVELLAVSAWGNGTLLLLWLAEKMLLLPIILLLVYNLRKLQAGGERLAAGETDAAIDTTFMFWHFKKHAEHLNHLSDGLNQAVEARMKSERFKTELITNVSHDIKTPLTSIINYVDLLKKEEPKGERVQEYLAVLERQSGRLKKLIEDLVEASKATSGSLSVNLQPCLVDIALTQVVGEYQEKLEAVGLKLIVKKPTEPITVLADGRHLWRVFDNLLGNICKHALPGSRVYLTLEEQNDSVVITLKNISKYELDISSEELMERFVRGDRSRNTEGNGLGLSIARSLTELQNGQFSIQIDGDLFKAILVFPAVKKIFTEQK